MGQIDKDYCIDGLITNKIIYEFLGEGMLPIATNEWGYYITIAISKKQCENQFLGYNSIHHAVCFTCFWSIPLFLRIELLVKIKALGFGIIERKQI